MYYKYVGALIILIILTSIQYSLNKIIILLKEIRNILKSNNIMNREEWKSYPYFLGNIIFKI